MTLKPRDFLRMKSYIPCLEEQQKIAEFLSTIDTVIAKQKETVSAWEKRKKGVMQKLFSQEVRFKADDGSKFPDWEEKKLGDICKTFSGGTPKSGKTRYYENGTISFIRSGEIHDDKTELRITKDGLNESSAKMVDIGDILYALYGATSGEVDISKIKGAINQAILCIRPLNDFHRKFIVEILRHNKELFCEHIFKADREIYHLRLFKVWFLIFLVLQNSKKLRIVFHHWMKSLRSRKLHWLRGKN